MSPKNFSPSHSIRVAKSEDQNGGFKKNTSQCWTFFLPVMFGLPVTSPTKRMLNSGQIQLAPWVFQPMMVWGTDPEMMCQADLAQTPNTPLSFRNPETRSVRNNLGVEIRPQRRVKNGLTCSVYFNFCQFRKYTNHTYYYPHITSSLKAQNHPPKYKHH